MREGQLEQIRKVLKRSVEKSMFYKEKFKGIEVGDIQSSLDFENLPFTDKFELREAYPLGLQAVPDDEVVRVHSSSGTTGMPIIIPYTKRDIKDWAIMFKRCYETANVTSLDRVQITPGYGLWTAGIGFQNGAELLGAMTIPMGPGNTEKQLQIMRDLRATVLCATSSYALLLAEEIKKRKCKDKIYLKKAIIGSERSGDKIRDRIATELGVELYDIYGLTEIYGPGIGISCDQGCGIHYWDDYVYFEIINPKTGKVVPEGEMGELVITTLKKEGAPLIRYRTHDLTRFLKGKCACGLNYPRIDTIMGRSDDMMKVKGVNIFPSQVEQVLLKVKGVSSEYQVQIEHLDGKDRMILLFETEKTEAAKTIEERVEKLFKTQIGISIMPKAVQMGSLPRSEKKSSRIFDKRY